MEFMGISDYSKMPPKNPRMKTLRDSYHLRDMESYLRMMDVHESGRCMIGGVGNIRESTEDL